VDYTLVDIGIGTSYDFFFEVAWPNYYRFARERTRVTAINASWPLWHLREWYFWEQRPCGETLKSFTQRVLTECPELGWLSDIADAGKHRVLHRPAVKVRAVSARHLGGGIGTAAISSAPIGGFVSELVIDVGGTAHDLHGVIRAAVCYWLAKVLPYHVEFPLTPDDVAERGESMIDWCRERLGDERAEKKRWAVLQGANAPHFVQRLAFLELDDAKAFKLRFGLK
jgi:hypothetical protein